MATPPPKLLARVLMQRNELRFALTAGLMNGLAFMSGIPYGYYATLAVLSSMGNNYGSSMELGRQRVMGSLLGALMLVICYEGLRGVPLPLSLALALGGQRLLGGLLGLRVGYKVGGVVIVMGWLVHSEQFGSWLPLRLFWTVVGVIVALVSLRLFWPSSAISAGWAGWSALLHQLAEALKAQVSPAPDQPLPTGLAWMAPLRARLNALRSSLPAIRDELGGGDHRHPTMRLLTCLDETCSRSLGLMRALQRLQREDPSPDAVRSPEEIALLLATAERLQIWAQALNPNGRNRLHGLPPAPDPLFDPPGDWLGAPASALGGAMEPQALARLERLALRQQLCWQLIGVLQRGEREWQRHGG